MTKTTIEQINETIRKIESYRGPGDDNDMIFAYNPEKMHYYTAGYNNHGQVIVTCKNHQQALDEVEGAFARIVLQRESDYHFKLFKENEKTYKDTISLFREHNECYARGANLGWCISINTETFEKGFENIIDFLEIALPACKSGSVLSIPIPAYMLAREIARRSANKTMKLLEQQRESTGQMDD